MSESPSTLQRRAELVLLLAWIAAVIAATIQQGVAHQNNNFLIFRAASLHLLHGQDLYGAYPALHKDFYKYSPTFALLFLPFAVIPFAVGMLLWNALNAGALYYALGTVLPRRGATIARAIVFMDMLGSLQNVQSNALVAALIILCFAAYERGRTTAGTIASEIGGAIKLFPLAALSFAIFHPRKVRVAIATLLGGAVLLLLPLLVTTPRLLVAQYGWWRAIERVDALHRGFSVMQMLHLVTRTDIPNWPIQLAGTLVLLAPVLARRERWREWRFRLVYLASVLVFCLIFNHQAESPTFVIGLAGAAVWFAALPAWRRSDWALLVFVITCTVLASSDAMPVVLQRELFDRYEVKVVPLIVLWAVIQRSLWKRTSAVAQATATATSTATAAT